MTLREFVDPIAVAAYLVGLLVLALGAFSWGNQPVYWIAVGVAFIIPIVFIMKATPN